MEGDVVLCDIDGTLCDVRGIRHFVEGQQKYRDFDAFHHASIGCPSNASVVRLLSVASGRGMRTVLVTGRREKFAFLTALWLRDQGIAYADLLMRGRSDLRSDATVKAEMLDRIRSRYNVALAIDDNPVAISVWTNAGIPTVEVGPDGELLRLIADGAVASARALAVKLLDESEPGRAY